MKKFILIILLLPIFASAQIGKFHPERYQSVKTILNGDTTYVQKIGVIDFYKDHIVIDGTTYQVLPRDSTVQILTVDFYYQTFYIANPDGTSGELDILYQDNYEPLEVIYKKDADNSIAYYTWI